MSDVYFSDIDLLTEQIAVKRERLAKASGKTRYELNRELMCLYEMRRDCAITAEILRGYYNPDNSKHFVARFKRTAP